MRDAEKAPIICKVARGSLVPMTAWDAEQLEKHPIGAEVRVKITRPRSLPRQRTYWKALSYVIEGAGWTMTSEHLHNEIKERLGYVVPYRTMTGELRYEPDSTAFDNMDEAEFGEFFEKAMALVSEHSGCDPLGFLADEKVAA